MSEQDALHVCKRYFLAWSSGGLDAAAGWLADDLAVEVPINHYPTKASFVRAVGLTQESCSGITTLSQLGGQGEAVLLYDMTLPFGVMRVAEHFAVSDNKITHLRQVHDTHQLRQAMAAMGRNASQE